MAEKALENAEVEVVQDFDESTIAKKEGQIAIDPQLEKKVLRKVDWHLVPIFLVLQLCAFIDRYVKWELLSVFLLI